MTQEIHGTVADGFEAVREEFTAFVAGERPDYEGQLCAYVHGRKVVDLWAGRAPTPDSLYGVYSSTKGAAHLVVALLVQDGTLELDRKVTYYWPEFAAEGKGALTLRELLAHRAGVVGLDAGFTRAGAGRRPGDGRTARGPAAVLAPGHGLRLSRARHRRAQPARSYAGRPAARSRRCTRSGSAPRTDWTSTWGCPRRWSRASAPCSR